MGGFSAILFFTAGTDCNRFIIRCGAKKSWLRLLTFGVFTHLLFDTTGANRKSCSGRFLVFIPLDTYGRLVSPDAAYEMTAPSVCRAEILGRVLIGMLVQLGENKTASLLSEQEGCFL